MQRPFRGSPPCAQVRLGEHARGPGALQGGGADTPRAPRAGPPRPPETGLPAAAALAGAPCLSHETLAEAPPCPCPPPHGHVAGQASWFASGRNMRTSRLRDFEAHPPGQGLKRCRRWYSQPVINAAVSRQSDVAEFAQEAYEQPIVPMSASSRATITSMLGRDVCWPLLADFG